MIKNFLNILGPVLLSGFLITGCAGPTSPFGGIENTTAGPTPETDKRENGRSIASLSPEEVKVEFSPQKQIYHKSFDLTIKLVDPAGIEDLENIKLTYNGQKINQLIGHSLKWKLASDDQTAELKVENLKLPAHQEHDIEVNYRRGQEEFTVSYPQPSCEFEGSEKLKSLGSFQRDEHMLKMIELLATKKKINASFLAALVVQESGLNPLSLGNGQRLGLTHMRTSDAYKVLNQPQYKEWPSYPRIEQIGTLGLYSRMALGLINADNEWRLDPEKSLKGGITYLKSLESFWKQDEQKELLQKFKETNLSDLILASYYTGPNQVRRALENSNDQNKSHHEVYSHWPQIKELKGHCFEFSSAQI